MNSSRNSKLEPEEAIKRLAATEAKLAHHARATRTVLFLLLLVAAFILGLLVGHISGVPWLSHQHQ
jgi:hypothetical protein